MRGARLLQELLSQKESLVDLVVDNSMVSPWGGKGPALYRKHMTPEQWELVMQAARAAAQAGVFLQTRGGLCAPRTWMKISSEMNTEHICEQIRITLKETLLETATTSPRAAANECQMMAKMLYTRRRSS